MRGGCRRISGASDEGRWWSLMGTWEKNWNCRHCERRHQRELGTTQSGVDVRLERREQQLEVWHEG